MLILENLTQLNYFVDTLLVFLSLLPIRVGLTISLKRCFSPKLVQGPLTDMANYWQTPKLKVGFQSLW